MPTKPPGKKKKKLLPRIGWREWVALPALGIGEVKVKVDTGARSSALHAFDIVLFTVGGEPWVRFSVHPIQRNFRTTVVAEAPLADRRWVRPSTGKPTLRPVIHTPLVLGKRRWPIELTLVNRDMMGFRMLLGRQAIRNRFLVHPGRSFLAERPVVTLSGRSVE